MGMQSVHSGPHDLEIGLLVAELGGQGVKLVDGLSAGLTNLLPGGA